MLAGEIGFGVGGGPSIINVNSQRTSIVAVERTLNRMIMKIMASSQIKTPADIRGKRIAITRYGTSTDFAAGLFLRSWGLSPEKDAVILQVGSVPNIVASLQSGTSQAKSPFSACPFAGGEWALPSWWTCRREIFIIPSLTSPCRQHSWQRIEI